MQNLVGIQVCQVECNGPGNASLSSKSSGIFGSNDVVADNAEVEDDVGFFLNCYYCGNSIIWVRENFTNLIGN